MTNENDKTGDPKPLVAPFATERDANLSEAEKKESHELIAPNKKRTKTLWWVTIAIITVGLIWACYYFFYGQYHEYTDDAYANGNMVNIHSAVPGSVIAYYADDTDLVVEGQLLVQLDATEYQALYEEDLAGLAAAVLQVRQLYDNVEASRAHANNMRIQLARAQYDYDNRSTLIESQAISNEDFIHSQDSLAIARLNLKQAEYQLKSAESAAGNTSIEKHPIIEKAKARVRDAYYKLKHCQIFAPATGYVAERSVEVGQWVTHTTALMAVIPEDYVWVDANYKETQLTYMRIGQPAKIWFDLYGSHVEYTGKVIGIASGSGSVFSLIPPQNATGNWIKIVQRLAVRISLDKETLKQFPSRLGISAEVNVDITDQDLPMLAETPPSKAVAVTNVYNIDMEAVDAIINDIVQENLKGGKL